MLPNELYSRIFNELSIKSWNKLSLISEKFNFLVYCLNYFHQVSLDNLPEINFNLTDLRLMRPKDETLIHLRKLKKLTHLEIINYYEQMTDDGLVHLKGLINLKDLNLTGCEQMTDNGLVHLKGLTHLKDLNLTRCKWITDNGLVHLKGLTHLKDLDLTDCCQITDDGLVHLKELAVEISQFNFM